MRRQIFKGFLLGCGTVACGFLLGSLICLLITLSSCKPQKVVERIEIPVVTTQEHTIEKVRVEHSRDTMQQRDSIYHFVKGDTVLIERWHYLKNTASTSHVDTVFQTDSIEVPVVKTHTVHDIQEVEKPLAWWQKTLMFCGGTSVAAILLFVVLRFRRR